MYKRQTFDAVEADLARAKEASDFVIVFAHWGEEDTFRPNDYEKTWAQVLADGGADLIIGGHPHVVQPARVLMAEDGREVPVVYSLGNFLSHQTQAQYMLGGMASVTICKDCLLYTSARSFSTGSTRSSSISRLRNSGRNVWWSRAST